MYKLIYPLAALAATIGLVTCTPRPGGRNAGIQYSSADGYVFQRKQFEHRDLNIHIVVHPTQKDLSASLTSTDGYQVMAWSTIDKTSNSCTIHIVDPYSSYAPQWTGHELYHCIYGEWHDQPKVVRTK